MRVIAGTCKGRHLHADQEGIIRPTSDRVREAMFSMIADRIAGAAVLDIFAGSGALGIEALSRGARKAVFVDHHPVSLRILKENLIHCHLLPHATLLKGQVAEQKLCRQLRETTLESFELIFIDPPYAQGLVPITLAWLEECAIASPHTLLIAEREHVPTQAYTPIIGQWSMTKVRIHGQTRIELWTKLV